MTATTVPTVIKKKPQINEINQSQPTLNILQNHLMNTNFESTRANFELMNVGLDEVESHINIRNGSRIDFDVVDINSHRLWESVLTKESSYSLINVLIAVNIQFLVAQENFEGKTLTKEEMDRANYLKSCTDILPVIENGYYEIKQYVEYGAPYMKMVCNDNFEPAWPTSEYICEKGQWMFDKLPECLRKFLRIKNCTDALPNMENGYYQIDHYVQNGPLMRFFCNDNFAVAWPTISEYRCIDGKWSFSELPECLPICDKENWNNSWTRCVPDCGFKNNPDALLTSNELQLGDFPHHVGVYFKFKTKATNDLKYICGGSIISVRLVITAVYCVILPVTQKTISLDLFDVFVAAGKFYSDYDAPLDRNFQKRQVIKLEIPADSIYFHDDREYLSKVGILVIDEPFIFDNIVQPVCVDWFSEHSTVSYNGYVVGWGDKKYKASPTLNIRLVTAFYNRRDETFLTSKKICTNPDQGCNICLGDIGSGLVAAKNINGSTKYYIRNIVNGGGLDENICDERTTAQYTDFVRGTFFIIGKLIEYPNIVIINGTSGLSQSSKCKVPFISNGRLLISGKLYSSRKPIPNYSIVYIQCNTDTYLYPLNTKYVICRDGKFNTHLPKCSKKCPPLKSETVKLICELNGEITNCALPSFEGTIVTMLCIANHVNTMTDEQYATAVCRDGVWDQPFLVCQPACTKQMAFSQVDIYQNISNDTARPKGKYICGGTIISDNIILSAAQCFTNESNGELLSLKLFRLYPRRNVNKITNFLEVKIPHEYKGKLSKFAPNLALIKLEKPLLLNIDNIRIACFDEPLNYLQELQQAKFRNGQIAGRYDNQVYKNATTNVFKAPFSVDYAIIDPYNITECVYDVTKDIETNDTFCAGKLFATIVNSAIVNENGKVDIVTTEQNYSSICFYSPGAGYFTEGKEKYTTFLQGVASFRVLDKTCAEEEEKYLFTAVEKYQPFIKSGIEEFSICKIPDIQNSNFTIYERNCRINESIPNFSFVRVKCHNSFQIFPPFLDFIVCINGTYNQKLPYCIQCGQIRETNIQDEAKDGLTASEIPWHVEIYHNITYKCAGTLIHPRIIITNSLCFPDTIENFQIAVGEQNIDSNLTDFSQKQSVNKTEIKVLDEIALVILKNPFILNENVQPICLDWKDKFGYQEMNSSQPGIVISSNLNDADKNENKTWKIEKFLDVDSSEAFLQQYNKPLLPNYFSAKTIEGPNVCLQDIGSGIAIKNIDGVYFLRGVFTSTTKESPTLCTFIKLSYYLPFITNATESIEL